MRSTRVTRREMLGTIGAVVAGASARAAAQGRCMLTFGSPACNTSAIPPIFPPTGWKTAALDHLTFQAADYRAEAAFYVALMGWTLASDDGSQAVLDIGEWGTVVFRKAGAGAFDSARPAAVGGRPPARAAVESFSFVIEPWDTKAVEAGLQARNLAPLADHGGDGFESFWVKDPDGWPLQICNSRGFAAKRKRAAAPVAPSVPAPFPSTGWKTVWLDHLSFSVTNYKESASFYTNLLGWQPTYDEGSQNELLIGEVGDAIVRGGNPLAPGFAPPSPRRARIDHISFGIAPWDTDGVKAALESRGLKAQVDTSSKHLGPDGTYVPDDIHTAAFKSYHTDTPNGYNLQISYVTRENRLALANAVRPKPTSK